VYRTKRTGRTGTQRNRSTEANKKKAINKTRGEEREEKATVLKKRRSRSMKEMRKRKIRHQSKSSYRYLG
jgi:hypothetical protein